MTDSTDDHTPDDGAAGDDTADAEAGSDSNNVIQLRSRRDADHTVISPDSTGSDDGGADVMPLPHDLPVRSTGTDPAPLMHRLQALLFVSSTPLTLEVLAQAAGESEEDVHAALLDLMTEWSNGSSGIVLERVAGGWALRTSDNVHDSVMRLCEPPAESRLTPSALETLAVVAYLQPVSRPDVARIRGVSVDAAMASLLDRGFVEEAGRSQTGAVQFRTTALFERAFGLAGLGALPVLDGFGPGEDDVERLREQLEQMASARVE